jgi:integrase/recombinase XerD
MKHDLIPVHCGDSALSQFALPSIVRDAGPKAARRFVEFFAANIRNRGTREVYARAVGRFCRWCELHSLKLADVQPVIVAAYVEQITQQLAKPTVKQHLAAIRMLFDFLVTGQVVPVIFKTASRSAGVR